MTFGTVRLKNVAGVVVSNVDKHSTDGEPAVKLCNYVDVYKNTYIDSNLPFMDSTASEEQVRRYSLRANDVIITKDSETPFDIAVPALVTEDIPGLVCGYHLAVIRANTNALNPRFLLRAFQAKTTASYFATSANGITRYGLTYHSLKNVPLPLPPISEQERIANFLDRETAEADALVVKYERLIELLEEKRVALITQAVTKGLDPSVPMKDSGVAWIGEIPDRWTIGPVGRAVVDICDGPFGSSLKSSHYTDSGIQVIRLQNIGKGRFHNYNRAFIETGYFESLNGHDARPGDLLVAGLGDTNNFLGRSCLVPEELGPAMVKADCFRLRLNAGVLLHEFAMHYLNSEPARAEVALASKGATRERINLGGVASLRIPIPPIPEQQAIIAAIDDQLNRIELICKKVQNAIDLTSEHRATLITAAVTGQIDVSTYRSNKHPIEVPA